MSIEQAMIQRAAPRMLARRLASAVDNEVTKGCLPDLSATPVRLEPLFHPLGFGNPDEPAKYAVPEAPIPESELTRLRVWISPDEKCDWNRSELFIKQLSGLTHRIAYEIAGNREGIRINLLSHHQDLLPVTTAFRAMFHFSEVSTEQTSPIRTAMAGRQPHIELADFFPRPPYSHLLTTYEELKTTAFGALLQGLSQIEAPGVGFYQCVFQPVDNESDWHRNVETLLDLEYEMKLHNVTKLGRQYVQQAPSGDLHQMARDVDTKAHNDRPFYCVAVRIGTIAPTPRPRQVLRTLTSFMSVFQHGGRPLNWVSADEYHHFFSGDVLPLMIRRGITFRPGFLVNSRELVGLVHVFHAPVVKERDLPLKPLERLPVRDQSLLNGTCIGECSYAGTVQRVCIPTDVRERSTHIMSSSGMGKSTVMLNMFVQDVAAGRGAVLIDVHGDAVKKARSLIPLNRHSQTIYFDPGDTEWIPLWNPLALEPGQNPYRLADDIVGSLRRVFSDWGDRLEHVVRNGLIGLSYLKGASLLDLYSLVRQGSTESEELRKQIVNVAVDEPVRKFWQADFCNDYRKSDLQAPKHKLSKLVSAGSVSLMLSQIENRISFRRIMDEGMILLVDLSTVGSDVAEILGAFILSLLLTTAMSRSDVEEHQRRPFSIFADEAHRFVAADAIENIIVQARKFGINLTIAHQYLAQFGSRKVDAISTVGCTVVGCVDKHDSHYFAKDMRDMVDPKDIMALRRFEMIARIGTEVVRVNTLPPPPPPASSDASQIVEMTRKNYCRRADVVRQGIARRSERWYQPFVPGSEDELGWKFTEGELTYDEF